MKQTIQMTVDGQPISAEPGSLLLDCLADHGIQLPTLCNHPSLEPSGACRLCVVEISHADWGGWSGLVTACLYPAEAGLQIFTRSQRVRNTRTTLLELYLARCPDSEEIRSLARREGIDTTPFPAAEGANSCIQCGLCTRVCNDLGPAAIAPLGRGVDKTVGPRPDRFGEDCTGCLACGHVCPTGEIDFRFENGTLTIWNRDFEVALCSVQPDLCRGCGACEAVCPLAIPRVTAYRNGNFVARIAPTHCVGCGLCAGACPTGAIEQLGYPDDTLAGFGLGDDLRGRVVTFACSRSPLPDAGEDLIPVPCVGRLGLEHLLGCLARGADGVLVLCRDQASCPYGPGGRLGVERVNRAAELARAAGLGGDRIRFVHPAPGQAGPALAVTTYRDSLAPTPLQDVYPAADEPTGGLDRALAICHWLQSRPELTPQLPDNVQDIFPPVTGESDTVFYLGDLPLLDLLLAELSPDRRLTDVFKDAVDLLVDKGVTARLAFTQEEVETGSASRVIVFGADGYPAFSRPVEIVTLDELAGNERPAGLLGRRAASRFRFQIDQATRREYFDRLQLTPGELICATVYELAQIRLLLRQGAWLQNSYREPMLACRFRARAGSGEIVT
ncbi:MAG: 4Fe-4S dicluster domain-containing protein [bacterium]